MGTVLTIALSLIGSSALFTFIQFLITRRDKNNGQFKQVVSRIEDMNKRVEAGFETMNSEVKTLRQDMERTSATTARVRILRASDEISHKMRHSKEWFDQLNDDINFYQNYCKNNPDFINNKAKHAVDNINEVYGKALKDNDFL